MIIKWKMFNFKSVRKETELEFAPLTIFAGTNSSGKSTILQSILLVAQTLAHKVSSRSVVLNGAFARLGQFDDLRSTDSDADQIVIGWTCQPSQEPSAKRARNFRAGPFYYPASSRSIFSVSCEIAFDTEGSRLEKEITQIQPRLFSSQLSAATRDPEGGERRSFMTIRRASPTTDTRKQKWMDASDSDDPLARTSLQYDVELDEDSLAEIREEIVSAEPVGCLFRHFLPDRLSVGIDVIKEQIQMIMNVLVGEDPRRIPRRYCVDPEITIPNAVIDFILDLAAKVDVEAGRSLSEQLRRQPALFGSSTTSLHELHEALRRIRPRFRLEIRRQVAEAEELEPLLSASIRKERQAQLAVVPSRPPSTIAEACWYLDRFFSTSVRYLGPLRDEPKSLYPLAPTVDPSEVGLKGEHTAAVLELYKNRPIRYISSKAFTQAEVTAGTITGSLESAVIDWLQYLDVAEGVQSRDRGKFGHELKVSLSENSRPHDLTHVGVGVSQVLPILVASLLASPDTTLIFEQPEIHLHPKVQTLLADFFLSMTLLGKQCIVETHSEYLINRLRFRAASGQREGSVTSKLRIYFVEKVNGCSQFREVRVNEYGAIPDWPDGFFDQSQTEAENILRAATLKRKAKREK